jgi:membrane protease YdiL (CAAX protease family)
VSPTILDHLFALLLVLSLPLLGAWQLRRLRARLAAGEPDVRVRQYRTVIVEEILLAGAVAALWVAYDRPWSALAPATPTGWPDWVRWAGWGAAAGICLLLVAQAAALVRNPEGLAAARRQLERVADFLPHTRRELGVFQILSLAAGVGEEIVFRGFAMPWLAAVAAGAGLGGGAALWAAAIGSSVMFGLAHSYQGAAGAVRTGAVGLGLAGLAVATGGLLAPMLVHSVVDLTSGRIAWLALRGPVAADPVSV